MQNKINNTAVSVDLITTEVVRNALTSIAEQMSVTIQRSSFSTVIREILDYSTAIFDRQGRIIAQATRIPVHINSMTTALEYTLTHEIPIEQWQDKDIIMLNDPYSGGQHLPDIMTFTPVYVDGEIIAIAGSLGHQIDVGGSAASSYGSLTTEIYQEGLRIPPVKLHIGGEPNDAVFKIFQANIREPIKTIGDVKAQLAALEIGKNGLIRLANKYGMQTLIACIDTLMANSERRMRARIKEIPDGVYCFEDWNDDDGITDTPIKIKVAITVQDDEITVDFTGSNKQVAGPVNSPIGTTYSATFCAMMSIIDPTIPPNYGCYVPIHVIAPLGTVMNPVAPAPVVGRMTVGHRIVDVIMGAMSQVVPESVTAAYYGMSNVYAVSGLDAENKSWLLFDLEVGGWGARPTKDGLDAYSCGFHNLANTPMEMFEMLFPVRFTSYALCEDTGGPGKYRGGLALKRELVLMEDYTRETADFTTQGERVKFAPFGLFGGKHGSRGIFTVVKPEGTELIPSKTTNYKVRKGDIMSIQTQGGGGYGNPFERDPELVLSDVLEEKVTLSHAEKEYGVIIDTTRMQVDYEKTASRRLSKS
jgi:N-methylhydantoinase B